jgi:8-amino-7-oxononanoate synthase
MSGMESAPLAETVLDGRRYLYFGGTGYFGLQGHPAVVRAGLRAFPRYGTHSATSRAGFGDNPVLLDVEILLRRFFREEAAVTFGSGYLGSLVLGRALADRIDIVFVDELAHFSINDAASTLGKPVARFRHRDPDDLRKILKKKLRARQRPFLLSDGVFPVFGQIAPVPAYANVLGQYDGLIGLVRAKSGAYIGSTPTPTPIAAATAKGIEILMKHPEMRDRLRRNAAALKAGVRRLGIEAEDSPVPIVAWSMRSEKAMREIQKTLMRRGIAISYLKYVGAPAAGVLRVSVFSTHTAPQIRRLLDELARVL